MAEQNQLDTNGDIRRGTSAVETEQETGQGTRASSPSLIGCIIKRYYHQIGRVMGHTDAGVSTL